MAKPNLHNNQKLLQFLGVSQNQESQKIKEVLAKKNEFLLIPEIDQYMEKDDNKAANNIDQQFLLILNVMTHLTADQLAKRQQEIIRDIEINIFLKKKNITATTEATAEILAQKAATTNLEKISELIKAMAQKELANKIKKLKREMNKNFSAGRKTPPYNATGNGKINENTSGREVLKKQSDSCQKVETN